MNVVVLHFQEKTGVQQLSFKGLSCISLSLEFVLPIQIIPRNKPRDESRIQALLRIEYPGVIKEHVIIRVKVNNVESIIWNL